jgi:hypothetical protein
MTRTTGDTMGIAYYLSIQHCPKDFDVSMDGKYFGREIGSLNNYASTAQLKPLNDFYSQNPDDLLDILNSADRKIYEEHGGKDRLPPEEWFSPTEGLKTVYRLIQWVETKPKEIKKPDGVRMDLNRIAEILNEAQRRGLKFHFSIDV